MFFWFSLRNSFSRNNVTPFVCSLKIYNAGLLLDNDLWDRSINLPKCYLPSSSFLMSETAKNAAAALLKVLAAVGNLKKLIVEKMNTSPVYMQHYMKIALLLTVS